MRRAALALVAASVFAAVPAVAQGPSAGPAAEAPSRAERLFREGRAASAAGDYETACARLSQSQELEPAPGTLLNIADCEEHLGRLEAAREHWKLAASGFRNDDHRRQFALDRAAALEARMASSPHGPQPADKPSAPPPSTTAPAPADSHAARPPVGRTVGFAVGGVGLAGLATGGIFGALAIGKASTVRAHCNASYVCDQTGVDAGTSGRTFALVSTVSVIAGAALTATGAVLVLTSHRRSDDSPRAALSIVPVVGPGGAGASAALSF